MEFPQFILNTSAVTQPTPPDHHTRYDMLILGGGPAAMSAAVYAARKMLNIALITLDFGGQINETWDVENYLGFQHINAKDLVDRFLEHVKSFNLPVGIGVAVKEVSKNNNIFIVVMEDGARFMGKTVIYVTGERHRRLTVPGEKEFMGKGISYCAICDAPLYKDRKVMIVGGGNSAFTTALDLSRGNAEITIVNVVQGWQADAILQQRVREYQKIEFLDSYEVIRIEGGKNVEGAVVRNRSTGEERRLSVNGIFVEIGLLPNSDPVKNLVKLNEGGEVIVDCTCRTNVSGLFAAGDVTTVPHKQIIISAGEGAKAALSAYDYLVQTSQV
jgi:NADH-dependent peroxiredoxin subunit F